jgi:hypothetical protein
MTEVPIHGWQPMRVRETSGRKSPKQAIRACTKAAVTAPFSACGTTRKTGQPSTSGSFSRSG